MLTLLLAWPLAAGAATAQPCCELRVLVRDSATGAPIAGARIEASGPAGAAEASTDSAGFALLALAAPLAWRVSASAAGYESLEREIKAAPGPPLELEFLLTPRSRQSVTVEAQAPGAPESATAAPVTSGQLKPLPTDPATVRDALPLIPGIVRSPEGRLRISGGPEHRSALLVNALDVTDPATGKFGATVPIDVVAALNVYKSPFLAEYGRFTAAVVAVDTRPGGDQWRWELNDPTPELRLRSRRIRGVRGFTPRISGSGPLRPGRLYLSQALEYRLNKTPIFTLPFPRNEEKRESWNSLTQLDWMSGAKALTATLHGVPQRANFVNLSFYNPQPAAPGFRGHEYRAALAGRFARGGDLLETAVSAGEVAAIVGPQGESEFTFTPVVNRGNYFARQRRRARRYQIAQNWSPAPVAGAHHLKMGASLVRAELHGEFAARPVNIRDLDGALLRRIEFENRGPFRLADWDAALFAHDRWQLRPALSLDAGLRADWQRLSGLWRLAPRLALSWSPFGDSATVLRAGYGWFYDRVPLSLYGFPWYPERRLPRLANVLETTGGGPSPLIWGAARAGGFAPRSRSFHAQLDHRLNRMVRLRAGWLRSRASGLPVLRPTTDALRLGPLGRSRYDQLELLARLSWQPEQQLLFSYVHSRSRGHLNEFSEFLGDFPTPLVRGDFFAEAPASIPHRFLAWGVVPLSPRVRIAPVVEYRTGFPYSALTAAQDYAGSPQSRRFPPFFSLDLRVARDIHVRKHAVQLSFSLFNVTNHFNPDTVRLNVADPQFGEHLGHHRRRYRLDLDFLF